MIADARDGLECVSFMLLMGGYVLAEKRKPNKKVLPGAITLPGGHLEPHESLEQALHRELGEELGVESLQSVYVCQKMVKAEELLRIHYYAIARWSGEIANREADSLLWLPLSELDQLELEIDRAAVREYLCLDDAPHAAGRAAQL